MAAKTNPNWPVLTSYDQKNLWRIALGLGGIGTGTVSLGGRGDLRDWELVNRPAKGYTPKYTFFALYAKAAGGQAVCKALEGVIDGAAYEGAFGSTVPNHSLPRFRKASFHAAYPLGQVLLSDPDVPVDVRIEGFNPLVPADAAASGIPVAVLRYVLTNKTATTVQAAVCGSLENFIGFDGTEGKPCKNVNEFRKGEGVQGLFMRSTGVDPKAAPWGTMSLATTARTGVSYRTSWLRIGWNFELLDFWDKFSSNGKLEDLPDQSKASYAGPPTWGDTGNPSADPLNNPQGSLAVKVSLAPGESKSVTFLVGWHFPNRQTWTPKPAAPGAACGCGGACDPENRVGNYYTTRYADAWDVALRTARELPDLEARTVKFVRAMVQSDLPAEVREAALYNLTSLRSTTAFRIESGQLMGWEGCGDKNGCCHGTCTHVWNYEQATAFLFGELAWTMRQIEFDHATDDKGRMNFRVNLPLGRAQEFGPAAADGQMGCIMKVYRDWKLSGDDRRLVELYPKVRKAVEFCWIPGGWDGDRDGVMEGPQHNTMDVEYYGPNAQMTGWYLGALRAMEEMARHVGEGDFANTCRDLFTRGSRWMDQNLFNGQWYEQQVRPPTGPVPPELVIGMGGKADVARQDVQLGSACLVDQLVGQYMAHICGLGYLLEPAKVRTTLQSIMKYNWRENFFSHFNQMRSFVLNEDQALLMASYPRGKRPKFPFPYFAEVMTGFEYTAAVGMMYEGDVAAGLKVVAAIRARYTGGNRNPFNEAECGNHYARAMASWAAVLAMTGFQYDGVTQTMAFAASKKPAQWFWSNGHAWGTVRQKKVKGGVEVSLEVSEGTLKLRKLCLSGAGEIELPQALALTAGKTAKWCL
jgi:uncharacterized protein (DUF608 family)